MNDRADLVTGWLRKADSDLSSAELCLESDRALDTVCFHAQQAAEKCLKAYLIACDVDLPFIHNLEKLAELAATQDPSFRTIKTLTRGLTPYAVELRYDNEFWPSTETAREALNAAIEIKEFVFKRLPADMRPDGP